MLSRYISVAVASLGALAAACGDQGGLPDGTRAPDKSGIALLISPEEGRLVALLVDTIDDQRQVVIKGLQESYGHVPGVAAATILGDGQIALILDPTHLVQNAGLPETSPETNRKAS